jgi:hypothetical protein
MGNDHVTQYTLRGYAFALRDIAPFGNVLGTLGEIGCSN